MKFFLNKIVNNHGLMLKLFFYIANKLVDATENEMDNRILGHLTHILGEIDFDNLEEEKLD